MKIAEILDNIKLLFVEETIYWETTTTEKCRPYMRDSEMDSISEQRVWKPYRRACRIGNTVYFNPLKEEFHFIKKR